jgi:peptidoglycan/LPS O-acetylase OafA/YrhL
LATNDTPAEIQSDDVAQGIPSSENKKNYPALDGFRAIAVLMVFGQHYYLNTRPYSALNWGWAGVDFFFVLSGFLITGILFDTRNTAHRFHNFYVRRTLRIFPLYYGILILILVTQPLFHWNWNWRFSVWPLYLGNYARFVSSNPQLGSFSTSGALFGHRLTLLFGHFWSLCVEEQFYLIWPLVVYGVRDRIRLRNLCVIVCVACLVARVACALYLPEHYIKAEILYRLTPLRADALLLGGLLALMTRGPESGKVKRLARPALFAFIACFAVFEASYMLYYHHAYVALPVYPILDTVGFTLIDIFAAILILVLLQPGGLLFKAFTIRPLRQLGQVSYGFYVFHDIPHLFYLRLSTRLTHGPFLTMPLAFCCTLLLSFLSFRYFEAPFLRLKERYTIR